jgi:hypothetical protein
MGWDSDGQILERHRRGDVEPGEPEPRRRRGLSRLVGGYERQDRGWALAFGLAVVLVWLALGIFVVDCLVLATADCFSLNGCPDQNRLAQEYAVLSVLFMVATVVMSGLAMAAARGSRQATGALAILSGLGCVLLIAAPSIGIASVPMFLLAAWRWTSLDARPVGADEHGQHVDDGGPEPAWRAEAR